MNRQTRYVHSLLTDQSPQAKRERSLAGTYLRQAVEHLHAAGSAPALFPAFYRTQESPNETAAAVATADAKKKQLDALRSAILFAALAAEAYVNEFITVFLKGKDLEAVEKMSTVDKYVLGTRLAIGKPLFERTKNPARAIKDLFKLRNKLVHPKPGYGPPAIREVFRHEESEFTPTNAARFIWYVAGAAVIMVSRAFPESKFDYPADVIWFGRDAIFDYALEIAKGLPDRMADAPDDLMAQAAKALTEDQQEATPADKRLRDDPPERD